jgi:hypothetical protein
MTPEERGEIDFRSQAETVKYYIHPWIGEILLLVLVILFFLPMAAAVVPNACTWHGEEGHKLFLLGTWRLIQTGMDHNELA